MQNSAPARRPFLKTLLLIAAFTVALAGCSREEVDDTVPAEELYERAHSALQARAWPQAIDRYKQLTTRYPFGRHAEQAQLDMAYAQYKAGSSEEAITTLDRFIRTYPTHPNVDYAWYLKGLVNYSQTMGFMRRLFPGQVVDRDQTSARQAFMDFQEMIRRFPESRYVADARQRMVFLRNVMAEQDVVIGEYYFRRGAYIAAINRARHVIENFPQAPANIDALDLMARSYARLDLTELAADTRRVLEHNYPDAELKEDEPGFLGKLWPFD
ncbi:outer membrane protein assembly factor BamD [Wenzhouxiangella sp. EGI_FJ10305]|uniref:outer membrane protein assembly factor BamD n=1 Tax=Wenzhouxiangella sp. EGI_FJ10305 TaxID=3243768 RepID=UPI0035DA36C4